MKHSNTWFASILIASALLLSVVRIASAVESKNHRTQNHQAETTPQPESIENKEPEIPFAVWQATVSALHKSIADNEQQAIAAQKQAQADKQTFCSPAVVVNEILAAVGFGYLLLMYLQWSSIDQQVKVAKKTADTAEKTLRLAERAWVSIQVDRMDDLIHIEHWRSQSIPDDIKLMVAVKYRFINSGKTAARLNHSGAKFKTIVEADLPKSFDAFGYTGGSQQPVIIAPNLPYELAMVTHLNKQSLQNLLIGKERLAFYGFVRYLDVLDQPHETHFCMMSTFTPGGPPTFGVDGPPGYNYFD